MRPRDRQGAGVARNGGVGSCGVELASKQGHLARAGRRGGETVTKSMWQAHHRRFGLRPRALGARVVGQTHLHIQQHRNPWIESRGLDPDRVGVGVKERIRGFSSRVPRAGHSDPVGAVIGDTQRPAVGGGVPPDGFIGTRGRNPPLQGRRRNTGRPFRRSSRRNFDAPGRRDSRRNCWGAHRSRPIPEPITGRTRGQGSRGPCVGLD